MNQEVQGTKEVPQGQYIDRIVDVSVCCNTKYDPSEQCDRVQCSRRTLEIHQVRFIDRIVEVLVVMPMLNQEHTSHHFQQQVQAHFLSVTTTAQQFQETRTIDSAGSEGLVGMKVNSVKFQVVLFVFQVCSGHRILHNPSAVPACSLLVFEGKQAFKTVVYTRTRRFYCFRG